MANEAQSPDHQRPVVAHMMTPGVVQIPGDVSVTEAASLLERERMPCLLIKDTESRFGLMTPADIVKKVVAQGLEPDDIEVRAIMTRPVQFIEYDRAVEDASMLMMSTGAPILIVTQQNQPVGVLTAKDLVLARQRCPTPIAATVAEEGQGEGHQVFIIQLSHVGALIESPSLSLLPGTNIVLRFALPGLNSTVTTRGRILNGTDPTDQPESTPVSTLRKVAIQFAQLSSVDQTQIKAWILQNAPSPSDLS